MRWKRFLRGGKGRRCFYFKKAKSMWRMLWFYRVTNLNALKKQLGNIWIKDKKIHINRPSIDVMNST